MNAFLMWISEREWVNTEIGKNGGKKHWT